jgi:preprotein translocase subunit SecB
MRDQATKRTGVSEPSPTVSVPEFQFERFNVVRLIFQEVPKVALAEGEQWAPPHAIQMSINVTVGVSDALLAQVRLVLGVKPDPRVKPYEIQVEVVGQFSTKNGTRDQLAGFCRSVGPTILFPYVRQLIDGVSSNGRYGKVRLNPTNIQAVLGATEWSAVQPPTDLP